MAEPLTPLYDTKTDGSHTYPPAPTMSQPGRQPESPRNALAQSNDAPSATVPMTSVTSEPKLQGYSLADILGHFTTNAAYMATTRQDYDKAKKVMQILTEHHGRAKNMSRFPAAQEVINKRREQCQSEVSSLNQRLRSYQDQYSRQKEQVAKLLNLQVESGAVSAAAEFTKQQQAELKSQLTQKLRTKLKTELQAEFQERMQGEMQAQIRAQIQAFKREYDKKYDQMATLPEIRFLHQRIDDREKAQSKELAEIKGALQHPPAQARDQDQMLQQVRCELGELKDTVQLLADSRTQDESLLSAVSELKSQLEQLQSKKAMQMTEFAQKLDKLQKAMHANETAAENLNDLLKRIEQLEEKLNRPSEVSDPHVTRALPTGQTSDLEQARENALTMLDAQVQRLEKVSGAALSQLDGQVQRWESLFKEHVTARSALDNEQSNAIKSLEASLNYKLQRAMAQLSSAAALSGDINRRLQVVETAIVSLESRYNQISTEPIVERVLKTVQETYPAANAIRATIQNTSNLMGRVNQMHQMNQMNRTGQTAPTQEFAELRNTVTEQANKISALTQETSQVQMESRKNREDFQRAKEALEQKVSLQADNISAIEADIRSLRSTVSRNAEESDRYHTIRGEHIDQLAALIKRIKNSVEGDIRFLRECVQNNRGEAGSVDVKRIQERLEALESKSKSRLTDIKKRVDDLERGYEHIARHVEMGQKPLRHSNGVLRLTLERPSLDDSDDSTSDDAGMLIAPDGRVLGSGARGKRKRDGSAGHSSHIKSSRKRNTIVTPSSNAATSPGSASSTSRKKSKIAEDSAEAEL